MGEIIRSGDEFRNPRTARIDEPVVDDYRSHMRHILSHMDSAPGEKVVGITFDDMKSELHGFQFEVWPMETRD